MILGLSTRTNFCYSHVHVHKWVWPTLKVAKSINKIYNSYRQQAFSLLIPVKQYSFHLQVSSPFWKQILQSTSCLAIDYSTNSKRSTNDFFGANTDISAIHGVTANTNISTIFKSCFLFHYQKYNVFMPYLFLKNLKNQDLWAKLFQNFSNFNIFLWFLINLINDDTFVLAATVIAGSMFILSASLWKRTCKITVLPGLLCFLVWMCEEYNRVLSTLMEAKLAFWLIPIYQWNSNQSISTNNRLINTLRAGLIQAVRKKQLIQTWLCGWISQLLFALATRRKSQKTWPV